jgi:hypothetical protein
VLRPWPTHASPCATPDDDDDLLPVVSYSPVVPEVPPSHPWSHPWEGSASESSERHRDHRRADFMSAVAAAFSSFVLLTLQLLASYLSLNFMLHSPEASRVLNPFIFKLTLLRNGYFPDRRSGAQKSD